jgi:putative phage-type endonuclease
MTTPATLVTESAELVLPYDAPRPVWLKARRSGIGGSDALACLGLDPWKTRMEVYLDKLGQAPAREQTDRMRWGQIVEAAILDWFVERTGLKVERWGLLRNVDRPWQLSSVDGATDDGGIVEIKNTNWHRRGEWEDDQVADGAEAQSQHYLDVTGRTHAWVVAQIGGDPPVIRRVDRDDDLIGHIRAMEHDLWRLVEARTPPALDGGRASEQLVNRLFPNGVPGSTVEVDGTFLDLLRTNKAGRAAEAAAEGHKKAAKVEATYLMGDATEAIYNGQVVATWRQSKPTVECDIAALQERWPEVAAQVLSEKPGSRRFVNKIPKELI